jgi:signal transduction histidine kinase
MRRFEYLLWAAASGFGLIAEWRGPGFDDAATWIPDLVTGWTLLAAGFVARARRPQTRFGLLLAATSMTWFAGTVWSALATLHRGPLAQALFSFPSGRLTSVLDRVSVGLVYVTWPLGTVEAATIVFAVLLLAVTVATHRAAVGAERRGGTVAVRAAAAISIVIGAGAAARLAFPEGDADDPALFAYESVVCAAAVSLTAVLAGARWLRPPVADLVVELGETRATAVRDALAHALGDPSLEVAYAADGAWVDMRGQPVVLPAVGAGRAVTPIERNGMPVAVLVHDPEVLDDPGVAAAVTRAARLAAANAQLQSDVRAQAAALEASRRRLLVAGDAERRRLEHRLREGTERRLTRLAAELEQARRSAPGDAVAAIEHAERQLVRTIAELHELAHGLHPRLLIERGLEGALAEVAQRSTLDVELTVTVEGLSEDLGAAVYFVCSEALVNAAKHASATMVTIEVATGDGELTVQVVDDGRGGADPVRGSGLRGLADRVEALGGELRINSPVGGGTLIDARLPLAEA